jgi:hypothetical protein
MEQRCSRRVDPSDRWGESMIHKGVKYSITRTEISGVWKWQFRFGDLAKIGKTEPRLRLLAMRAIPMRAAERALCVLCNL